MKGWKPKTEVELARAVVDWLETEGWDVYQEVRVERTRADIVAFEPGTRSPRRALIVECKLELTLPLLSQALRWNMLAHWAAVGVPVGLGFLTDVRKLGMEIVDWKRLGFIPVGERGVVTERVKLGPGNVKADAYDLIQTCRTEHKTRAPAGSNKGGYVTEFSETVSRLVAFVLENPGVDIKTASRNVTHHYDGLDPSWTFRVRMTDLIKKKKIKGIRGEEKGGLLHLFPAQTDSPVIGSNLK